ncbi:histidinol-phosphate aminotransferase [Palleronia marisminoris]|uniref:Histidinol-phosphate aminotransferase n=1 Tax=Palleronia marisminoris TaxID=315423 RepID=A0A1Y5T878_9RHOB|nr:histidinol-phosphate transaminase [Palleronia marisminoris]SFH17339.1 histidinol-phosphate aminotransferase [Palleronia marisminoris]SLN55983.1 Histidinol-phosphate aminotransferase 2 [Palleronia marisminoris]
MSHAIEPKPGVLHIAPYQGGESTAPGIKDVVKLSSNENPFGPPESARKVLRKVEHLLHRYPSTDHASLRAAIGEMHGLDPELIVCGAGSDELIHMLCTAYTGPGTEVIHTEHGFAMYRLSALAAGATPVCVAEHERKVDVDRILDAVSFRTKLVFVANPANPTGTMLGSNEIGRLASELPENVLLVLDGAYAEYVDGYDGGARLVSKRENVVMTRTFSKIYGLGGLRVGWAYAPAHVIDVLNRVRGPFNLGTLQLAAAEAAVRDRDYVNRSRAENARMRTWMAKALAEVGVMSDTSTANFVLARFDSAEEASACNAHLKSEGLLVRQVTGYGLPNCLRITVGDEASCRRVVHAITVFKGSEE